MKDYKIEIYKKYLRNREINKVPQHINSFNSRKPFYLNLIKCHFPKDRQISILDLGCGSGGFLYFMNKMGYKNTLGVDLSDDSVTAAKELGIDNILEEDIFDFLESQPKQSFDIITAIDLIEHLPKEYVLKFAKLTQKCLKPAGKLILHQPNGEGVFVGGVLFGDFTHETAFTRKSINQIFKTTGFTSVTCFEDKPLCYNLKSVVRRALWIFVVRPIYALFLAVETGGFDKKTIFTQNFIAVVNK